jgi:hypothetical protein
MASVLGNVTLNKAGLPKIRSEAGVEFNSIHHSNVQFGRDGCHSFGNFSILRDSAQKTGPDNGLPSPSDRALIPKAGTFESEKIINP